MVWGLVVMPKVLDLPVYYSILRSCLYRSHVCNIVCAGRGTLSPLLGAGGLSLFYLQPWGRLKALTQCQKTLLAQNSDGSAGNSWPAERFCRQEQISRWIHSPSARKLQFSCIGCGRGDLPSEHEEEAPHVPSPMLSASLKILDASLEHKRAVALPALQNTGLEREEHSSSFVPFPARRCSH